MSYSVDEWFADNVRPKLKELVEYEDLNTTKFTDFIKEILNDGHPKSEMFASLLLEAIMGDDVEGLHKKISKCFSLFTSLTDCELVSLVYKDDFDLIECKYNGVELQD